MCLRRSTRVWSFPRPRLAPAAAHRHFQCQPARQPASQPAIQPVPGFWLVKRLLLSVRGPIAGHAELCVCVCLGASTPVFATVYTFVVHPAAGTGVGRCPQTPPERASQTAPGAWFVKPLLLSVRETIAGRADLSFRPFRETNNKHLLQQ